MKAQHRLTVYQRASGAVCNKAAGQIQATVAALPWRKKAMKAVISRQLDHLSRSI